LISPEKPVASGKERFGKFLGCLLKHRSAQEVAQPSFSLFPEHACSIAGETTFVAATNKRWEKADHA